MNYESLALGLATEYKSPCNRQASHELLFEHEIMNVNLGKYVFIILIYKIAIDVEELRLK